MALITPLNPLSPTSSPSLPPSLTLGLTPPFLPPRPCAQEIFEKVGSIKSAVVNYAQNGVSLGTATVTFRRSADADKAAAEYDRAEVDGKPMYIKLIGQLQSTPHVVKKTQPAPPAPTPMAIPPNLTPTLPPGFVAASPTMPGFNPAMFNPLAFNPFASVQFGGAGGGGGGGGGRGYTSTTFPRGEVRCEGMG